MWQMDGVWVGRTCAAAIAGGQVPDDGGSGTNWGSGVGKWVISKNLSEGFNGNGEKKGGLRQVPKFGGWAYTKTEQKAALGWGWGVRHMACEAGELNYKHVQFEMPFTHPSGDVRSEIFKVIAQGTKLVWKYQF